MDGGQAVGEVGLDAGGVLVFVHEDVMEAAAVFFGDVGAFFEEAQAVDEKVVEIHALGLALAGGVEVVDLEHGVDVGLGGGEAVFEGFAEVGLAAGGEAEDAVEDVGLGEFLVALEPEFGDALLEEAGGVVFVEDGEGALVA